MLLVEQKGKEIQQEGRRGRLVLQRTTKRGGTTRNGGGRKGKRNNNREAGTIGISLSPGL